MNLKSLNGKWAIIGTIVLLILLFTGIYYLVLYPKLGLIDQKESELKTQQQILATLESKIVKSNENKFESTASLQELVPVKPLTEQLLLDIERAEVISGSFVVSMGFSEGELTNQGEPTPEGEEVLVDETDTESDQTQLDDAAEEGANEGEVIESSVPEGVKKITISMNIESPSYFELETFIQSLESSERIMVVEAIDFTANDEIIETEQVDKPLAYQVTLSAFYLPQLTDLLDHLPKMESPEPAKKKNPFSNFGNINNDQIQFNDISTMNSIVKDGENLIYTVRSGDTIFDLSIKFYNSTEGIQKIRDANAIVGNGIFTGQKLIIPDVANEDANIE